MVTFRSGLRGPLSDLHREVGRPATEPGGNANDAITTTELPITYGPAVLVAGKEDCDLEYPVHGTWTTDTDGTVLMRDGWFECAVTNNDARIAGTARYTLNMDQWAMPDEMAAQAMWGTIRIENDRGAWEADYVGVYTDVLGDVFAALFTGSGDYEGLSYYQWAWRHLGHRGQPRDSSSPACRRRPENRDRLSTPAIAELGEFRR